MNGVPDSAPSADSRPRKVKNRVLWTVQIVFSLFFILASVPKLVGVDGAVETFDTIGWGDWFRYFTGIVELAGGIGLLVPRLCGLAATGLSITMVLAAATQVFLLDAPEQAPLPLVLAVLVAWLAYERRETIVSLREIRSR